MFNKGENTPKSEANDLNLKENNSDVDFTEENIAGGKVEDGVEEVLDDVKEVSSEEQILTLQAELQQSKTQLDDYYNRLQRMQAEFDNYRKRTQKEKEEMVKYASEKVIEAMLPILDNFDRAILSADKSKDFDAFAKGVEMIFKQMQNTLAKEGLKEIEAVGKPFDPNIHEAVLRVETEDHPENTVVEELQKGYFLKDRVLRPSMVKVSG